METEILWGRALAHQKIEEVKREIERLALQVGRPPGLAVILVGNDPASLVYVSHKERASGKVGIHSFSYRLPFPTTTGELLDLIGKLNEREDVDGILVQLPLSPHIPEREVLSAISPEKDVDGFHPLNIGKLSLGEKGFIPCTSRGIIEMLDHYEVDVEGLDVTIVGASNIVGKPLSLILLNRMATVSVCHIKTKDLEKYTSVADIVISATGVAHLIKPYMVKDGAIVIDVGISRIDEKILGDADFEHLLGKVKAITPVPGGVGPVTVAMLMVNTLEAYMKRNSL